MAPRIKIVKKKEIHSIDLNLIDIQDLKEIGEDLMV